VISEQSGITDFFYYNTLACGVLPYYQNNNEEVTINNPDIPVIIAPVVSPFA